MRVLCLNGRKTVQPPMLPALKLANKVNLFQQQRQAAPPSSGWFPAGLAARDVRCPEQRYFQNATDHPAGRFNGTEQQTARRVLLDIPTSGEYLASKSYLRRQGWICLQLSRQLLASQPGRLRITAIRPRLTLQFQGINPHRSSPKGETAPEA